MEAKRRPGGECSSGKCQLCPTGIGGFVAKECKIETTIIGRIGALTTWDGT